MDFTKVIGIYCDNAIYSVLLFSSGAIETKKVEKHEGHFRHFKFIKFLKSLGVLDLCVIVQNDESKPIINYLRREKKRLFLPIDYSPISEQANYKENPDLLTIARKLGYRKKLSEINFPTDQKDLKTKIDNLGEGDEAIHMRSLDGFVLAWMAAAHGIFSTEN